MGGRGRSENAAAALHSRSAVRDGSALADSQVHSTRLQVGQRPRSDCLSVRGSPRQSGQVSWAGRARLESKRGALLPGGDEWARETLRVERQLLKASWSSGPRYWRRSWSGWWQPETGVKSG